jgi:hypothetical protein
MPIALKTTYLAVIPMAMEEQLGRRADGKPQPPPEVRIEAGKALTLVLVDDPRPRQGTATALIEARPGRFKARQHTLRFRTSGANAQATLPLPKGTYEVRVDWEPALQVSRLNRDIDRRGD